MKTGKKNILLFVGPTPPPFSGPELSMKEFLSSPILKDSFEIEFVRTNFRKSNQKKGKFGIPMVIGSFSYFTRLILSLVAKRPELVYYPITPTQLGWMGRDVWTILLCKTFGSRVLIHLRGSHFMTNFNQFNYFAKKIVSNSLKRVDGAIVQADYLHDQFSSFMHRAKIHTLYQSIDTSVYSLRSHLAKKELTILVVGHMTKAKGYTDILDLIPVVAETYPNVLFQFAGEKRSGERGVHFCQYSGKKIKYQDPFEAEARLLKTKFRRNYIHLGLIDGENKLRSFKAADVFLSASYSEGFSRALLEAMSVGLPLVYTPVGAHREVLSEQNGICFSPGDKTGMKEAILTMLASQTRDKLGTFNSSYAKSKFSSEIIAQNLVDIILRTIR